MAKRTKTELEKLRDIAEDYFIRLGKTGREIAELLEISEQTVSTWRKGRDGEKSWDDRKRDLQLTPVKLKELLMEEARKVVSGEESKVNADQLSKFMAAIDRLDKTVNPRTVMSVLQMRDNYMSEINPQRAIEDTEYNKMFLQHIISLES
ncbi:helix-turn-helix domain-containing protein [Dysgonomonas sp. 520]|uniref:helix-turn-helix domain-containing protein n=1 Tax=Dysgonomonas sp. 520 TaxID=2302931 RepID=UPI0013D41D3D|nr:helix-turn-helix domain-containing protein [Dysgonomonas sp. 520]NDW10943.1 DNA-binding response regulator [Dysgonomonas sp. 520]